MKRTNMIRRCFTAMLAGIACLSIGSCSDDNDQQTGDPGVNVSFEISVAQAEMLNAPATKAVAIARQQAQGL